MLNIAHKPPFWQTPVTSSAFSGSHTSEVYEMDCIAGMKEYPDKYFDLAVVDPPYGININHSMGRRKCQKKSNCKKADWDNEPPPLEYFYELFRVSKKQIVWGANHFISRMPYDSSCWIIWDKENGENDFADCEMAWASFGTAVRRFKFRWAGMLQGNMKDKEIRMHPTQKPVALYDFIYSRYATEGMKVLDTHLGSGSSRISANKAKLHFVGCEIDEEYFNKQNKRYEEFVSQARLW